MSELILKDISNSIEASSQYVSMLENISNSLDDVRIDSENFYKSSSQFKNATLDVSNLTPMDSLRHTLAVISNTRMALEEASINLKRQQIEKKYKIVELENAEGKEKELLEIDIEEIEIGISNSEDYVRGAIRKLSFMINQYKSLLEHMGIEHITEEDFEKNEKKNHIMVAFNQALCAARSRGGIIDEGNHIYLSQLGINGAQAQAEIFGLLQTEEELIKNGQEPSQIMVMRWLEALADKYVGLADELAEYRGLKTIDHQSLFQIEQ